MYGQTTKGLTHSVEANSDSCSCALLFFDLPLQAVMAPKLTREVKYKKPEVTAASRTLEKNGLLSL